MKQVSRRTPVKDRLMLTANRSATVSALLSRGLIDTPRLEAATVLAEERGQNLLETLVETGAVTRRELIEVAATAAGLGFVDLDEQSVGLAAVALVPADFARRSRILPISLENGELVVAVGIRQAGDLQLKDDLTRLTRARVRLVVAEGAEIESKINQVYRAEGELDDLTSDLVTDEPGESDLAGFTEVAEDAPVVRFVNLLITQAISDRASDIHIEPTEHDLRVRYRIDGVLHDAHRSPKNIQLGAVSRLKIMADMNIAERRVPQDGRDRKRTRLKSR